jgi:hypothetical protein
MTRPFLAAPGHCLHIGRQAVYEVLQDCITIVCLDCGQTHRLPQAKTRPSDPPAPTHVTADPAPPSGPEAESSGPKVCVIKVLADIPPFVGPDLETHTLKAGDTASLPASIAQLLQRRGKADIIEVG